MSQHKSESFSLPWWAMFLHLWGFDVALFAFLWAFAYAKLLGMPMMTSGPLVLLTVAAWLFYTFIRLRRAIRESAVGTDRYAAFIRGQLAPLAVFLACGTFTLVWMLFYFVSINLLYFAALPGLLMISMSAFPGVRARPYASIFLAWVWMGLYLLFACKISWESMSIIGFRYNPVMGLGLLGLEMFAFIRKSDLIESLRKSFALALACAVPAYYFSITESPSAMLFSAPIWYMTILFFLFSIERKIWLMPAGSSDRQMLSAFIPIGLVMLVLACLYTSHTAHEYERSICFTIIMGCACLELISRLRPYWSMDVRYALSWLIMGLPALLGILILHYAI